MTSPQTAPAALLRGGRLRKTNRGVLTFAPALATASAIALGALLSLAPMDSALAQETEDPMDKCTETTANSGMWTCTGAAGDGMVFERVARIMASTGTLTVTGESGFGNYVVGVGGQDTVTSGPALDISTTTGAGAMTVNLMGSNTLRTTTGDNPAINIDHQGAGNLMLTLGGTGTTIRAPVTGDPSHGIDVSTMGATAAAHTVTIDSTGATIGASGSGVGGAGIYAHQIHSGLLSITSGVIHSSDSANTGSGISGRGDGIRARAGGGGDINITAMGNITAGTQARSGTTGRTNIHNRIDSGIDATIDMEATAGNITITVASGQTVIGNRGIDARIRNASGTGSILIDIAGTVDSNATNGTAIAMNGGRSHTLRLRSTASITDAIATFDADGVTARTTGATLEILGTRTFDPPSGFTNINLAPTVSGVTAAATDSLSVTNIASGSTLTLNVDFMNNTADTLTIAENVTGSDGAITINLVATAGTALTDTINLVTFTTTANLDITDFTAGMLTGTATGTFTLSAGTGADAGILQIMPAGAAITPPCHNPDENMSGTYLCSGNATETQTLASEGEALMVTDDDTFTINVASGHALDLDTDTMSTGMTIDLDGSITTTGTSTDVGDGINANHSGTGAISITTGGSISATGDGIDATGAASTSSMTITTGAAITAAGHGINATHSGEADLSITTQANITSTAGYGIRIVTGSTAPNIRVTANGDITAEGGGQDAINANHSGSGNVTVITTGDIRAGGNAIDASIGETSNTTGTITVSISGSIDSDVEDSGDDAAITMRGGDDHRLIFNPGASIGEGDSVTTDITAAERNAAMEADRRSATLELAAAAGETASFNLADLANFTGFTDFDKTGTGTWTLTGTQPTGSAFTEASVTEGILRLDGTENAVTFRPGSSTLTIGGTTGDPAAILEILGNATIAGALDINQTGTATSTLGIDFTSDPTAPTAEQLEITGAVTGSVTLNLNVAADADVAYMDDPASSDRLLLVDAAMSTAANANAITPNPAGCAIQSGRRGTCTFTLLPVAGTGWYLESLLLEFLASDPTYEGYAATLTNLAALSSASTRLANRIYDPRNNIWGQIQGEQTTLKPNATSPGAEYDTQHSRVRFGFDMPAPPLKGVFETAPILGFNAWLGQSQTDITATDAEPGEVETDAFGFAASTTLQQNIFHFDGQLQYTAFSSDISVAGETRASNRGGDAISAAAEIGMRLPQMHGITLTPQIQLSWTSIDFDAFTDSEDTRIGLADGETTAARFGITATTPLTAEGLSLFSPRPIQGAREARGWVGDGAGAGTFLHASADLHLPLDGETSARIGDNITISDLEEESLSLGIGISHNWNATTLSADLATTQGEDTETYRASLSASLAF